LGRDEIERSETMKKTLVGIFLGAIVYFAAGALSWMVMPWMEHGMKKLPEELLIRDTLNVVVKEPGAYFFPSHKTDAGIMDEKSFAAHFRNGPAGLLFMCRPGVNRCRPKILLFPAFWLCLWPGRRWGC
jgi:hypothetical protein